MVNKTTNGKQYTILWHVDNLEISHVKSKVVDIILGKLGEGYGKDAPLLTTRVKNTRVHGYDAQLIQKEGSHDQDV